MLRRKFLKTGGVASIGSVLSINGLPLSLTNIAPVPLLDCDAINDRVLVIVRLAGANDGLNTLVPISQYDRYAVLRPTLRLPNLGQSNGIINLDSTLPDNQKVGLHPSMTGFKNLYDSGKLSIINSIGYPNFNYSHFAAESILWSGKDGNFAGSQDDGMIGRFLNAAYPGLSGRPSNSFQDPLVLHFGSQNPILSFVHNHGGGSVEYNVSNYQPGFFANLRSSTPIPTNSEYSSLQSYIAGVEQSIDLYYNRVTSSFNNGQNSATGYPDTDLAKQLKTIARLIAGGSKTKVFQCTLYGFDTHTSQVESGSAYTGYHASLLQNVSNSIASFFNDITQLGFADKVTTITFSEFGRKAIENGSLGTDHGNISPMFVIGNAVNPGIIGVNPNLNNVYPAPDGRFLDTELQYDYRRVYATLFQDWLGADNSLLQEAGIQAYQSAKLPIIATAQNAYPSCIRPSLAEACTAFDVTETDLLEAATVNGWTYYSLPGQTAYAFAIEKNPSGLGANTAQATIEVRLGTLTCSPNNLGCFIKSNAHEAILASDTYFNTKVVPGAELNGWVNIRWFFDASMLTDLETAALNFKNTSGANYLSPILWLKKINSRLKLIDNLREDGAGVHYATEKMHLFGTGAVDGQGYYEFRNVLNLNGTGGAAFKRVSHIDQNHAQYQLPTPLPNNKGTIRFNLLTKTFEGYDGAVWLPLH